MAITTPCISKFSFDDNYQQTPQGREPEGWVLLKNKNLDYNNETVNKNGVHEEIGSTDMYCYICFWSKLYDVAAKCSKPNIYEFANDG